MTVCTQNGSMPPPSRLRVCLFVTNESTACIIDLSSSCCPLCIQLEPLRHFSESLPVLTRFDAAVDLFFVTDIVLRCQCPTKGKNGKIRISDLQEEKAAICVSDLAKFAVDPVGMLPSAPRNNIHTLQVFCLWNRNRWRTEDCSLSRRSHGG